MVSLMSLVLTDLILILSINRHIPLAIIILAPIDPVVTKITWNE